MASIRLVVPTIIAASLLAGAGLALGQGPLQPAEPAEATDAATDGEASDGEAESDAEEDPEPATTLLQARSDDHAFTIVMEPGQPRKGRRVGLRLDLATIPENPHPTFGDRVPVRDASLIAVLKSPGENETVHKQSFHPHGGAGSYGLHWTPLESGLWELTIERQGEELPEASFRIGVDVKTPAQRDASLGRGPGGPSRILGGLERQQRGGGVVGPLTPATAGPTSSSVMGAFSEPADWLTGALSDSPDQEAAKQASSQLLSEARKLSGTVPRQYQAGEEDYDRLAGELVTRLQGLAEHLEEGEMSDARSHWRNTLDQNCAQCHVKFWWGISSDLSSWPTVSSRPWR